MRRILVLLPLLIFVGLAIFLWRGIGQDTTTIPSPLLGKPVPEFSLTSLYDENQMMSAADFTGPALINVWATWCPTCKQEHSQLNRIARDEGVTIYGINYKDDREKAQVWLDKYLDPYAKNVFDPNGRLGLDLGVYGAPETYLIDAEGIIRYKHIGEVNERVWQTLKAKMKALEGGS
ncbi:DsbE family thiol:disulfide interchange protein [Aliamphritea spongicola]|uniref:DsbE family thiol:disulfide interchange protein n=1 Tax=Aliamphritea spongicola TaxID=707589 RepID=UPI00196AB244|nr:DsbE family thiol:disulfide interchange protein [Aliamphritea spongicola]MBN3563550.1 DsbE family thiol:disulfide interchange protein [Aliamphritea spongicola]